MAQIDHGELPAPWAVTDGLITYNRKVFIQPSSPSLLVVIAASHDVSHEGIQKTLHRVRSDFYMVGMRRAIEDFVRACTTCQHNNTTNLHLAGLLLPLPVPVQVWEGIAMDFIEGLPRVNGKTVILTVVDRFSKCAHFIPLAHPYTATSVLTNVLHRHRLSSWSPSYHCL